MLSKLLNIANESGTSYPLAKNIASAAEKANEPGILEWANATAQLRLAEWALIVAAFLLIAWSATILLGVWCRWSVKLHILTTILAASGIAAGLWTHQRWTPPVNDAVIIRPSTPADGKQLITANIFISPFDTAEVIATLPLGSHLLLEPDKEANHHLRITQPNTNLNGWIPVKNIREVR